MRLELRNRCPRAIIAAYLVGGNVVYGGENGKNKVGYVNMTRRKKSLECFYSVDQDLG